MLKHIVMWKFHEEVEGKTAMQHAEWMKEKIDALVGAVPEIISLECGLDELATPASFHAVLTVVVEDTAALSRYANHPDHLCIVDYAKRVTAQRVVVDYHC